MSSLRDATTDAAAWLGRCEAAIGLDATLRPGERRPPGPESCVSLAPTQQMAAASADEVDPAAGRQSEKNRGSPAEPPSYRLHGSKSGPLSAGPPNWYAQLRPDPPRSFSLVSLIHKVCLVFAFLSVAALVSGLLTTYSPDFNALLFPDGRASSSFHSLSLSSSSSSSSSSTSSSSSSPSSYKTQLLPASQLEQFAFDSSSYSNIRFTIMALPSWLWRHALAYSAVLSSLLTSTHAAPATTLSATNYVANSVTAIRELNNAWYDVDTGLWNSAWWNSANAFTTLADFAQLRLDEANQLNVGGFLRNTFNQAQVTTVQVAKFVNAVGLPTTTHCINGKGCTSSVKRALQKRGFADFLDDFYDDEGWWALGLIHAHDATGDQDYLDSAIEIFNDMQTGAGTPCGGGIYWSKDRTYVNAIANELYLSVAAALANRVPSNGTYLQIAKAQWKWFHQSGMINSNNLINDGLDANCKNNGLTTWSYNQGVILGGLSELAIATGDGSYLSTAATIANAAINALSNSNGILIEADQCELVAGNCGMDGQQFKGVFVRNLRYLNDLAPNDNFKKFILRNAQSIWNNDRNSNNMLGVAWTGPFVAATGPSHSSALDALVAAIAVS